MPRKRLQCTIPSKLFLWKYLFFRLISLEVAISAISDFPISLSALGIAEIAKIAGVLIY
jgi:hypothetical protein